MTVAPDPSEITPPTDPATYGRPRSFGVAFWAVVALCVLSVVAGAAVTKFAPRLWDPPGEAPAADYLYAKEVRLGSYAAGRLPPPAAIVVSYSQEISTPLIVPPAVRKPDSFEMRGRVGLVER